MDRLDKTDAKQMNLSRSGARQLIRSGAVEVNDKKIFAADEQIDINSDELKISGKIVTVRRYLYIMLNKPSGVLTAARDKKQPTVMDLLPPEYAAIGCMPVGRLDKDTTGLLLLTTDGELNHRLLAPARHVDKTYLATLDKPVGEKEAAAFASGLSLSDFEAAPADLTPLPDNQARVTIHEGKFHQVKRMFAAVEREVLTLHRETFGSLALDEALPCGQWRELTEAEASALYRDAQMEEKHG